MRLLVVYGLKTTDYGWLEHFYPAFRLIETCKNRSIELRFLFPQDVSLFLASIEAHSFSPDKTFCLIRGTCPISTVVELEKFGYICYNSSFALKLANDKLETFHFLQKHKFSTPQTELFVHSDSKISHKFQYPLVLKPRNGSRGNSVHLIFSHEEMQTIIDNGQSLDEWIIQTYIESSYGRDLRIFFVHDKILASVVRTGPQGAFLSNASNGGSITHADRSSPAIKKIELMALEIAKQAGLFYGTVDFLFCDNHTEPKFTVGEINASPGYEALEKGCKLDIVGPLLDSIFSPIAHLTRT